MQLANSRIAGVLVIGIHDHGKDHLRTVCRRRRLVQAKRCRTFARDGFAIHRRTIGRTVAQQEIHILVVGICSIRVKAHRHFLCAALHLQRHHVRARPTRSCFLIRNKVAVAFRHRLVGRHGPGVAFPVIVPHILFPVGVTSEILVQQILDFAGPFFHVKHRKPCAEFGNEPAHARIAKALVEAVGFEQVFGLAVSVSVNPANRTRSNPCADKRREDVTILRTTQQVTLIFTGHASVIGTAARATESAVDEPTRIAFDRHEGRHKRCRVQESHAAVDTFAMTEHILLNPCVTRFLKPVRILCAGVTVRHRVNSLMNHRIHLRHAIAVGATRVETV